MTPLDKQKSNLRCGHRHDVPGVAISSFWPPLMNIQSLWQVNSLKTAIQAQRFPSHPDWCWRNCWFCLRFMSGSEGGKIFCFFSCNTRIFSATRGPQVRPGCQIYGNLCSFTKLIFFNYGSTLLDFNYSTKNVHNIEILECFSEDFHENIEIKKLDQEKNMFWIQINFIQTNCS